jgi:hypothetical protein
MSEYVKLKRKGLGRGRPRHTPEQRIKAQLQTSMRQEARRRAGIVLKTLYEDDFIEIYEQELKALIAESKRQTSKGKK